MNTIPVDELPRPKGQRLADDLPPDKQSEHKHQKFVVEWAAWKSLELPELKLLYAIPNGGKRGKATAGKLKAEGVRPGVPDLCLPVPRGKYCGAYIEMKAMKGTLSNEQKWWRNSLIEQGYHHVVAYGGQSAVEQLTAYLSLPKRKVT